jgi:cell division protein FtsQ
MLITAGAIYGLAATPAFGFEHLTISGNALTSSDAIRDQVGVQPGTNLVGLVTGPIVERLRALPAVADATVSAKLPDQLQVDVVERTPVVIWQVGDGRFAVDKGGVLFAQVPEDAPPEIADLPTVVDSRASATGLTIGSVLDPVDVDAAFRLGSLTPAQIGSRASGLHVEVTDMNGFTVSSGPKGWLAVFGKYGRSARTTDLIPGEVQLLTALFADHDEATIQTIFLSDERNGTYLPKPSASPSTKP